MKQILRDSMAHLAEPLLIGDPGDSVLGGQKLVKELEKESILLTAKSFGFGESPCCRPVLIWHKLLNPDRKEYLGFISTSMHQNSVLK